MIRDYNDICRNGVMICKTDFLKPGERIFSTEPGNKIFVREKPTRKRHSENRMLIGPTEICEYMQKYPRARPVDLQNYFDIGHCTATNYHRKYHAGRYGRPIEVDKIVNYG